MKKLIFTFVTISIVFTLISSTVRAQATNPKACMVIGMDADPTEGRKMFKKALDSLRRGKKSNAVDYYERAIIADHSILRHEDHGLAMSLLEKYRDINASQTPALLCKRAFLENILIGNMEDSIAFYEKAAKVAEKNEVAKRAEEEAERLQAQLEYLRNWQASVRAANERLRKRDLEDYLQRTRIDDLEDQLEDREMELEELQERLSYLEQQEEEVKEEMYATVENAARYRRRYYYPGAYTSPNPDPNQANNPPGQYGDVQNDSEQVANPYSTGSSNQRTSKYRFYTYRNSARRQQERLTQIRAEISGVHRRIAQTEKAIKELQQKISDEAVGEAIVTEN
jgi:hypothetical protein